MKSILLVMDMINDLVHPEGPNAATYGVKMRERGAYAATRLAIAKARVAGVPIGYVRIGFSPGYLECPPHSPVFRRAREAGLFQLGGWGTEVFAEFAPIAGDFDIVKHRVSPFYGTRLEPILRAHDIEQLVLCGVSTNGVVSAAIREGHDRDYQCVLIEDASAGATDDEHHSALEGLRRFATVTTATSLQFT